MINTGKAALKLCTLYVPPNHRDGVVHLTRANGARDSEHFDGETTRSSGSERPSVSLRL